MENLSSLSIPSVEPHGFLLEWKLNNIKTPFKNIIHYERVKRNDGKIFSVIKDKSYLIINF